MRTAKRNCLKITTIWNLLIDNFFNVWMNQISYDSIDQNNCNVHAILLNKQYIVIPKKHLSDSANKRSIWSHKNLVNSTKHFRWNACYIERKIYTIFMKTWLYVITVTFTEISAFYYSKLQQNSNAVPIRTLDSANK